MKDKNRIQHIFIELSEHLPYSIFGVVVAIVTMGILTFFITILRAEALLPKAAEDLFHIFHPVHLLLSAVVTTAMFWKHEKRFVKALIIGLAGSVLICGLSDIVFPYFGGRILGTHMQLHICLLEHPHIIIPFAVIGALVGFLVPSVIEKSTEFSHSMHVLVSSIASLLYLISFGVSEWTNMIGGVFIITVVAVMLPCCVSDIVFPLTFLDSDPETSKNP